MTRQTVRSLMVPALVVAAFGGGLVASGAQADQPYMYDALGQLQTARATLAAAAPDKGGHRLRAIALVDRAIGEVHAGMAFERGY